MLMGSNGFWFGLDAAMALPQEALARGEKLTMLWMDGPAVGESVVALRADLRHFAGELTKGDAAHLLLHEDGITG